MGLGAVAVATALALAASPAGAIPYRLHSGQYVSYAKIAGKRAPSNVRPSGASSLSGPVGREIFSNPIGYMNYSGGPVMPSTTNYVFKWVGSNYTGPAFGSGAGCGPDGHTVTCSSIPDGVNTYFHDLAAASAAHAPNPNQVATQYVANGGAPNFTVAAGGIITDTNPYPNSGCPSAPAVAGGRCLTNAQIQTELQSFLAANGFPNGLTNEYFVVTPQGVASCFDTAGQQCSGNAGAHPVFCAYHSRTATSGQYVYSNIPDVSDIAGCDPFASTSPGGDDTCSVFTCIWPNGYGDGVMSAVEHEQNESITDPEPNNAWADFSQLRNQPGDENGDKCNFDGLDDPSVDEHDNGDFTFTPTNVTVGAHRYLIQMEFSNQNFACLNHYSSSGSGPSASFSVASQGTAANFTATPGAAQYVWQFNDDVAPGHSPQQFTVTTTSPTISHTFPQLGTYTVALTAMANDGLSQASSQNVTLTNSPPPPTQQTLTVSKAGSGSGTVSSTDAQINCGATCSHAYDNGTQVTLTANPAAGSSFAGWSGAGCSGTGSCQVTMSSAQSVTATFAQSGPPSNNFSFGKPKLNKKNGTAKLPVTVPVAGNLTLSGKGLAPIHKAKAHGKAVSAGTTKLLVKTKGKAARKLKKKGKLKVTAKVKFTPNRGTAKTESKTIKLVRKR